jgi:hypothetical protein
MNTLEDRVRAATRAAADTVLPDSVPPLWLPPASPAGSRRQSWLGSPWARRLAPLGAALAVVVVAVAMVLVGRAVRAPVPAPEAGLGPPGPVTAGPPVSSYVASGQVPRYYVAIESRGNPNLNPSYAVVRATVTGAALATIPASVAHGTVVAVTAAADDRTFVLDEQRFVATDSNANQFVEPRTFYLVRLDASGRPGTPTRLPMTVPGGEMLTGFALSPDGSKLAIAVEPDNVKNDPNLEQILVYTLAAGAVRTWSGDGTIGFGPDDARSLSWAGDERTLAFFWAASPGIQTSVRLLDVETGGGSLLADSRQAVSLVNEPLPILTPATLRSQAASRYGSSPASSGYGSSPASSGYGSSPASSGYGSSPASSGYGSSPASASGQASPPEPTPVSSSASAPAAASVGSTPAPFPTVSFILSSGQSAPSLSCQEDSIITPDGSSIVCGAITAVNPTIKRDSRGGFAGLQRGAVTGFLEYSTATGKVTRILGHWTFGSVGALSVEVLWSNASGSVLIGVIPDAGGGQVGVISGNKFTPLPTATASVPSDSGTW